MTPEVGKYLQDDMYFMLKDTGKVVCLSIFIFAFIASNRFVMLHVYFLIPGTVGWLRLSGRRWACWTLSLVGGSRVLHEPPQSP